MQEQLNLNSTKGNTSSKTSIPTQPIFTDQFTPESTTAKEMLYRQMFDGGYDLYELRIEAHIMGYSHQAPFDQWEQLNYTFHTCEDAAAYAKAFPKLDIISYLHDFSVEIYKFSETTLNGELLLTARSEAPLTDLSWEAHDKQFLPSLLSATSKQSKPLFTDQFTPESEAEKKRLYEEYRQEGENLYELRVNAEVLSEVVQDDGVRLDSACSQVTYTFTFATFAEAKAYGEKIYSDSLKYPDIPRFDEHPASVGFVCPSGEHV